MGARVPRLFPGFRPRDLLCSSADCVPAIAEKHCGFSKGCAMIAQKGGSLAEVNILNPLKTFNGLPHHRSGGGFWGNSYKRRHPGLALCAKVLLKRRSASRGR